MATASQYIDRQTINRKNAYRSFREDIGPDDRNWLATPDGRLLPFDPAPVAAPLSDVRAAVEHQIELYTEDRKCKMSHVPIGEVLGMLREILELMPESN